jgi:hypothetical protein
VAREFDSLDLDRGFQLSIPIESIRESRETLESQNQKFKSRSLLDFDLKKTAKQAIFFLFNLKVICCLKAISMT